MAGAPGSLAHASWRMASRRAGEWTRRCCSSVDALRSNRARQWSAQRLGKRGHRPEATYYRRPLRRALRAAHEDAEAASVLGRLHSSQPDDVDVNVELARVEAARGDSPECATTRMRSKTSGTPQLRNAAVPFVSSSSNSSCAWTSIARPVARVAVVFADLPADKTWQMRAGELFLEAGDAKGCRALCCRTSGCT